MSNREAMQQALEALNLPSLKTQQMLQQRDAAIATLRAQLEQPEPYDQTALELCEVCCWKTLIPGDACLNCERKAQPQRKPLTHEQRFDLLTEFEAYRHSWHALGILIDMVEAAHGIKEET